MQEAPSSSSQRPARKSRVRYLLALGIVFILPVIAYLGYQIAMPMVDPCESLFRQTQMGMENNLKWLKNESTLQIKPEKVHELSERGELVALNLKSCCVVLNGGQINPEQFLQCKSSAFSFNQELDEIVSLAKQQTEATNTNPQPSAPQLERNQRITQLVNSLTSHSKQFNDNIVSIQQEHQANLLISAAKSIETSGQEKESNNTLMTPNKLPVNIWIDGEVSQTNDVDYFMLVAPDTHRDWLSVELNNLSTGLKPRLDVYNKNKSHIREMYDRTHGSNLSFEQLTQPAETLIVAVSAQDQNTTGKYALRVTAMQRYDKFEPNEDMLNPAEASLGKAIGADIMDGGDTDVYRFTPTETGNYRAFISNLSPVYTPRLDYYNFLKSHRREAFDRTHGANLVMDFEVSELAPFYIVVSDQDRNSAGKYTLQVSRQDP